MRRSDVRRRSRRRGSLRVLPLLWLAVASGCAAPEPLLVLAGPAEILSFAVRDGGGDLLWAIAADTPRRQAALFYGRVPVGYRQTVPADGSEPRALARGEALELRTVTALRTFHHWGFASGPSSFTVDDWAMELNEAAPGRGGPSAGREVTSGRSAGRRAPPPPPPTAA